MLHIQSLEDINKNINKDRLSFHYVERSDLTNVLNTTLMILLSIKFVLLPMLKDREDILLVLLVFSTNRTHALDLCLVSMSRTHFEKRGRFFNSQTLPSEGRGSTSTNTLSRMLPTPHFKLLG